MILVDISVRIEFLAGRGRQPSAEELVRVVTCGPIVQEVLQELREGRSSAVSGGRRNLS